MATEPTLIRRYTPPTCSLEIVAQQSPLSRWMGKVALKDVRFKLSFDDPRISDDDWVVLRGDRTQLEDLNQTVGDYVQSFLTQSAAIGTIEQDIAAQTAVAATELATPLTNTTGIALQPKGLLSHTLSLGSLATANSGDRLTLTSTQLADLSTALDEYSAEATTLPQLDRKVAWLPNTTQWSSPNWAGLAAGLLVTVGLGASLVNSLSNRSTPQTASQASSSDQRLAMQPPPSAPAPPTPNPFGSIPPLSQLPKPGAALPSPGATAMPTTTIAGLPSPTGNPKSDATNAPTIANTQGGQSTIKIAPVPQAGAAAGQSAASSSAAPVPAIVDQLGNLESKEPGPSANAATARSAAKEEGADRAAALGKFSAQSAPITPAAPLPVLAPSVVPSAQVNAVQSYFQQSWKPQKGLEQALQYELQLDASGALQGATPIGGTSTDQQSQAGIPVIGTVIGTAVPDGKPTTVRLVLEPGGGVQAFSQ
jgi:Domain of unknown function (DUF4335)